MRPIEYALIAGLFAVVGAQVAGITTEAPSPKPHCRAGDTEVLIGNKLLCAPPTVLYPAEVKP